MKIDLLIFNSRPKGGSEIIINWSTGESTVLYFNSAFPLHAQNEYQQAIYSLIDQQDIKSFDELFGLFTWWFIRFNLNSPIAVATFQNEERKRIGSKIKQIREELNIEAKQLAAITGIDPANLSRIEQGKYSVGLDILSKIANALGYQIDFVKSQNKLINHES